MTAKVERSEKETYSEKIGELQQTPQKVQLQMDQTRNRARFERMKTVYNEIGSGVARG